MGHAGYANFGDLNEMACQEFQEYVVADTVTLGTDIEGLTAGSISKYFSVWIKIYSQGSLLEAAGIRRMPRVPFGGKSAGEIAKEITETVNERIPPVPDAVFLPVTQKAIEWLSGPADDILRLQDVYLNAHERGRRGLPYGPGNSPSSKARAGRQAVQAFQFSAFPGSSEPWHQPLHIRTATPVRSGKYSIQRGAIQQLRDLVTELRDACSIVLQAFVGIRISEVCGLKALPIDPTTGMPACVEIQPSRSGLYEIFYVKGQLFKTTETPITVTWVAGLRPRGATYFPPPIRALLVLEQLFRPWRTLAEVNDLIVSFSGPKGLPKHRTTITPIVTENLREGQRIWVRHHVQLPAEFANWRITTHQWRKSFALYVIRTDSRMLPAVSQHFKHVSLAMTESAYVGTDADLLGIMEDTATHETTRILHEMITGKARAGGKMAEMIRDRAADIQTHLADMTEQDQRHELGRMVRASDVRVWSCDWGWCFFRPETARCHLPQPGHRVQALKPNDATRNPSTCCSCANLAVTDEHVDFWRARRTKWKKELADYQRLGRDELILVAKDRINQSDAVLRLIGAAQRRSEMSDAS
jgi:integrase